MLAQTRQVHHEGVFELTVHRLLHVFEIFVFRQLLELTAQIVFPVRAFFDLRHTLTGDQRAWAGNRLMLPFCGVMQILVVKIKGFVVIIDARHMRVGEDFTQQQRTVTHTRLQFAVDFADPAALPFFLVFPVGREACTRFGLNVVEPGVLRPFAAGPDVFTGD
ncbi:hypothetical protein D3C80_1366170 [compost metagenome]